MEAAWTQLEGPHVCVCVSGPTHSTRAPARLREAQPPLEPLAERERARELREVAALGRPALLGEVELVVDGAEHGARDGAVLRR